MAEDVRFSSLEILAAALVAAVLGVIGLSMFGAPVAPAHAGPASPCLLVPFAPHHFQLFGLQVCWSHPPLT